MPTTPATKAEIRTTIQKAGYKFNPYTMSAISDAANRILKILTGNQFHFFEMKESRAVLDIVSAILDNLEYSESGEQQ